MILIISKSQIESTTEEVITWLKYYQVPWKRVNGYDIQNEHLCVDKNETLIKGESLSTQLFPVAWYRRCLEGDAFDESMQETQTIKNILLDIKKTHTKLPLNYYYLTEFSSISKGPIKRISATKEILGSRTSILPPLYKPISIDFLS